MKHLRTLLILLLIQGGTVRGAEIHVASRTGNLEEVRTMLEAEPGLVHSLDETYEAPPLHFAAIGGHGEVVRLLLERGGNLDLDVLAFGGSPIHAAAYSGSRELVADLLKRGAELNPLSLAGTRPIHLAASWDHQAVVELLLERGVPVDTPTSRGATPLHSAAGSSRVEMARLLLERGAPVEARDEFGQTPLMVAMYRPNVDLVALLLRRGASPTCATKDGRTPLLEASQRGNPEIVGLLLDSGASVEEADETGLTPLQVAARAGHVETVARLLAAGADPEARELRHGWTALHQAAYRGSREIIGQLLARGADPAMPDQQGRLPLHLACRYGHEGVAGQLRGRCRKERGLEECFGPSPWLRKRGQAGSACIWYLGHSGYAVKTRDHLLIFDYWERNSPPEEALLASGWINPEEIQDQRVVVFSSHGHQDHYHAGMFQWRDRVPDITYVMGFEPEGQEDFVLVEPRQTKEIAGLRVHALESNDAGVGFLVEVDGLVLFHAGDHAYWDAAQWKDYCKEIDWIDSRTDRVDLAFLPITGCGGQNAENMQKGFCYALDRLEPRATFPAHAIDREHLYLEFATAVKETGRSAPILCPELKGDRFRYRKARGRAL